MNSPSDSYEGRSVLVVLVGARILPTSLFFIVDEEFPRFE